MAQHRYVEACAAFERAEAVHATIGVLLNLGDCYEQLGRLTRARSKFAEAEVTARRAGDAREGYARERALGVEARIPRLTVETSALGRVPGAALRIDGAEVAASRWASAIPLDPGRHTVAATAPRKKPWTVTFDLESSAVLRVPPLEDLPEVADGEGGAGGRWVWDAHHVVPLSLLAASAASVVVGIVLFTKSQDETNNEIPRLQVAAAMGLTPGQGTCSGSKTQACIDLQNAQNTRNMYSTWSDVSYAAAGVFAAGAAASWLLWPKSSTSSTFAVRVAPAVSARQSGLSLSGSF
ncbi:MAG TPA: tetratricopeptide repeat protein [Polyangiaceae bacterium]|nr:tetratricopeptide repeat protein [Polyangiaceae bacterium]